MFHIIFRHKMNLKNINNIKILYSCIQETYVQNVIQQLTQFFTVNVMSWTVWCTHQRWKRFRIKPRPRHNDQKID